MGSSLSTVSRVATSAREVDATGQHDVEAALARFVQQQFGQFRACLQSLGHAERSSSPAARQAWTDCKGRGFDVTYWQADERGRWQKRD